MAYFRCTTSGKGGGTLTVTCAEDFAGLTITCSKSGTTLYKVCPSTSPYEVVFNIPESGTWTVSGTIDGQTFSETVEIDIDFAVDLNNGFVWKTWVDTSSLLDSTDYSTLSDLLVDEEAVRELCTEHACVDYLCDSAEVNEDLATVIANDIFAKWVNLRDYSLDNMYANAAIADEMDEVDKYGYGEWALVGQVPTMTTNTTPYGTVSSSSTYHEGSTYYNPYLAFDGDDSTKWAATSAANESITYEFISAVKIHKVYIKADVYSNVVRLKNFEIHSSNDSGFSNPNIEYQGTMPQDGNGELSINISNPHSAKYWRIYCIDMTVSSSATTISIDTLQFYAWAPKGNVPVMTSNTAPYGEAFADTTSSPYPAYYAFDTDNTSYWASGSGAFPHYLGYKSTNPICVRKVRFRPDADAVTTPRVKNFKIQGSNTGDSNDWHDIYSDICPASNLYQTYSFSNDTYYLYHRLYVADSYVTSHNYCSIKSLQFYGRELSVSVPTMTGNTAPYGEVTSTAVDSTNYAWKAFDGDDTTYFSTTVTSNGHVTYKFNSPVKVLRALVKGHYNGSVYTMKNYKIQGSNDGFVNDTHDLGTYLYPTQASQFVEITSPGVYKYYRCLILDSYGTNLYLRVATLQFYGLDYSEKEFEVGTTRKWLYDHGVELETLTTYTNGSTTVATIGDDVITLSATTDNNKISEVYAPSIDLTPYNLMRCKIRNAIIYNSRCGHMGVGSSMPVTGDSSLSAKVAIGTDIPNNTGLDISSYNQTIYPTIVQTNGGSAIKAEISEWWLE